MSDSDDDIDDKCIKVAFVGDSGTGKTSIVNRFINAQFKKDYIQTKGVDFYNNIVNLPGVSVRVKVWDIGGQTLGGPSLKGYIYGADAVIFVYDITINETFENIIDWYDNIRKIFEADSHPLPSIALIGNKVDLEHSRVVRIDKHEKFALDHNMSSHFVSAKTGDSVKLCMYSIVASVCGVKLTQAELNRQKTVVRAEIQSVGASGESGLRGPPNQTRLHDSFRRSDMITAGSNSNNSSNLHDQDNSEICVIL